MTRLALLRVNTLPFDTLEALRGRRAVPLLDALAVLEERMAGDCARLEDGLHRAAGPRDDTAAPGEARARHALLAIKRDVHNRRPVREDSLREAHGRVTAEIAEGLARYGDSHRRRAALEATCARAVTEDLLESRRALTRLARDPFFEEGVGLASRSIVPRVRALERKDPAGWGHDERHVAAKIAAYLSRFCNKTSPNGLFCATAIAEIVDDGFSVDGAPVIERIDALLSLAEARKVAACLAVDSAVEPAVVPRPNPTLRERDGRFIFWKPASSRNPNDDEVLSQAKDHPVVRMFLEEAARGRSVRELLGAVGERCEADPGELESFYRALADKGLLIAEVEIPYNARTPLGHLARVCREAGCHPEWLDTVEKMEAEVRSLPDLAGPARSETMERIAATLERLPHNRALNRDELFRVDAASALRVRLPARTIDGLAISFRVYARMFAAIYPERIYLATLAARFLSAHPADTDVEMLDLYHGLFEAGKFERPASFPEPTSLAGESREREAAALRMARLKEFLAGRARRLGPGDELVLEDEEIEALLDGSPEPPWMCGVLFQLAADGRGEPGRIVLSSIFPGAGLALARFDHLLGGGALDEHNPIARELRRGWSPVERDGAVVAEMTYTHNARTANAALRPSIFRHEIELPGEKASPGARAIPLGDLTVRFDSAKTRFVLRSRTLDAEVIPVITSGVNPVGIISFLVNIGQQGFQPLGYFPGFEVEGVTRWPRVVHDRLVLFRERWVYGPEDRPVLPGPASRAPEAEFFVEATRWRRRHRLPRHVFAHTSADPKPRYVDLESPVLVDLLRRALAEPGVESLHVVEMLPRPEELLVRGPAGGYATEFLVQLQGPRPEGREP